MSKVNLAHDTGRLGPLAAYGGAKVPGPLWFTEAIGVPFETAQVMVEGCPIHYLRWGERSQPGLLLVHGNGAHAHWWSFIAPFLARDYNVAALDLSGMGESGHREHYTMALFAQEQLAVCADAGMFEGGEPPIIVGHSFGGFVTILAGALYGERLAGTVIVDAPVNPPGQPHGPPNRELRPHRVYPTLADALSRFRLAPEQPCENDFLIDHVARQSLKEVEGGWTWKFDPKIWRGFSIGDGSERLRSTKCRIAIFRGEQSSLLPPDVGAYMYALLGRSAPVVEIPQAQHHVLLDQPLAFIAALRALLADWNHSRPLRNPAA
ncbi:MAG: alpha/beta hydrolase [Alphaproteobacteria bacterium]|nr:alpha/beta hydrolase [Alphaproteobacteria bacterium]